MSDTDIVPFDMGTFGSRTTPAMAPQLRRAAAAAREALVDLAAERAEVARDRLRVEKGRIVDTQADKTFEFGELTKGQKLLRTIGSDIPVTPVPDWSVAGTSVAKVNGRSFVTGAHKYASDVKRPGMLHGKMLRPPSFGATLTSVDTSDPEKMDGVTVVRDGSFLGVVAPTELAANRALVAVRAEWDSKPQLSAADLFQHLKEHAREGRGGRGAARQGSIEEGLVQADHKFEAAFTVAYIAHAPLEPRAAVAEWADGKLTVWTGTQRPFGVQGELVSLFKLPKERVRVIVPDTGSGYGGKHSGEAAVEAARLAKAAGKPVKLVWTREEEFTWAYFRPAGVIEIAAGAKNDGTITAWQCHNYNSGASALRTPYNIANQLAEFHSVESPLRQGSYRALAATANHFARESSMDDLARAVRIDPLEFRLKNLKDERLRGVLEAAAAQFGWGRVQSGAGHGVGIAGGTEKGSYVATCAEVATDGAGGEPRIVRLVTAFECGAVLNPDHLRNQVEGAVVMGLGGALFEAIQFADGKILNPRFSKYRVPRFSDVPQLETVLMDRKDLPSAGAGETPIVTVAPAVGNAIFAATGTRLRSLPMLPDGWKAVAKAR
jgi:isoquinoline 1-oxidoreductase